MDEVIRVNVYSTHPIQYQVPWFRCLDGDGVKVKVYYDHIPGKGEKRQGFETEFQWDIPLLDGYDWQVRGRQTESERQFASLWSTLRPTDTDVVLVTGWHDTYLLKATLAAKLQGFPIIVRGESNALRDRPFWKRLGHRVLTRFYDRLLVIGKENRSFYRSYGISDDRMHTCPYFVENSRFNRKFEKLRSRRRKLRDSFGVPPEATCFLFAGKFIEKKRPQDVLTALRRVVDTGVNVFGLMVGDGPLENQLRSYAQRHDLPVTFTGFLNQTEIPEAYTAADALVLPSDYGETWGLVVNEAMIFKCPVIVSDRVGCGPDLVHDEETGFTFPYEDTAELANRIRWMAEHPERQREMGRQARDQILNGYTVERGVEGTVEALRAACSFPEN